MKVQNSPKASGNTGLFFAMNSRNKTAAVIHGFEHWEQVRTAFRCGIVMPDGQSANAIGRCKSQADFEQRAQHGGITILS